MDSSLLGKTTLATLVLGIVWLTTLFVFAPEAVAAPYAGPVEHSLMNNTSRQALLEAYETHVTAGNMDSADGLLGILDWLGATDTPAMGSSSLRLLNPWIRPGAKTMLSWNSPGSERCFAQVGWEGALPPRGSAIVGPVHGDTAFALTCTRKVNGVAQNDFMVTFLAMRQAKLSWQPRESADAVADVIPDSSGGFRIFYTKEPGEFSASITVSDPTAEEHTLVLGPGTYSFRVAALDASGTETSYSNTASKEIE
jgi:hypothetical protein